MSTANLPRTTNSVPQLKTMNAESLSQEADELSGKLRNSADISQMTAASQGAYEKLSSALSNGINSSALLNVPPDVASQAFRNSNLNFFDSKIQDNTKTGNFSTGLSESINKFTSALRSSTGAFTSSSSNLTRQGLTFVGSTTKKMIDGIDLPGAENLSSFFGKGIGQLGKLAGLGGDALQSPEKGLRSVVDSTSNSYSSGKSSLRTLMDSIGDASSAILTPIKQTTQIAYLATDPRMVSGVLRENLSFLPSSITDSIGYKAAGIMSSLGGNTHAKAANLLNKAYALETIFNVGTMEHDLGELLSTPNGYGGYGTYNSPYNYSITGYGGTYYPGVSSYSGNPNSYMALAGAINTLCDDSMIDQDVYNWSDDRDIWDMLLQAAMRTNAGQILAAILNCVNGGTSDYYTGRSTNIMRNNLSRMAMAGDTYGYRTAIEYAGVDIVTDPYQDSLALATNARYDPQSEADFRYILRELNIEEQRLLNTKYGIGNHQILDSQRVTAIQYADPGYRRQYMSDVDYASVNAAYAMYHR